MVEKSALNIDAAVAAARAHTEDYGRSKEFRAQWLGLTPISSDYSAQQVRAFGELVGSVTTTLAGWRVLDVGCGDGHWLRRMIDYDAAPEDVVGVDISDARFTIGRTKNPLVKLTQTDGHSLPFADGSFDLITQFVCFSNIPTQKLRQLTAAEIRRVLKKSGYVFWWDLHRTTAPADRDAALDPADYFDLPILRKEVGRHPSPAFGPFRGARWLVPLLQKLGHPPTHTAALIGPKL